MDYTTLNAQDKIAGLQNRIAQLEQEYFSNEVFSLEAHLIGNQEEEDQFELVKKGLEIRINGLTELVNELSKATEDTKDGDSK